MQQPVQLCEAQPKVSLACTASGSRVWHRGTHSTGRMCGKQALKGTQRTLLTAAVLQRHLQECKSMHSAPRKEPSNTMLNHKAMLCTFKPIRDRTRRTQAHLMLAAL
jgi:hypothetical protein